MRRADQSEFGVQQLRSWQRMARPARALWWLEEHPSPLQPLGQERSVAESFEHLAADADNEYAMIVSAIVRAHQHSTGAPKKDEDHAIGRSRGGLSTKIHTLVDALGKPLAFLLTPGQAHDLMGADALLPQMAADFLIPDRAFDADKRILHPLAAAGKSAVIPPRPNRVIPREFDRELYKMRHLIENFFCKL